MKKAAATGILFILVFFSEYNYKRKLEENLTCSKFTFRFVYVCARKQFFIEKAGWNWITFRKVDWTFPANLTAGKKAAMSVAFKWEFN